MRKKKTIKREQEEDESNLEETLLKNVALSYKHETDRLNQDL